MVNSTKANIAGHRRAMKKKELTVLRKAAISERVTVDMKSKYLRAKRSRENFLAKERERVKK